MMHRPTPPSLSDAPASVLAEKTRFYSLGDMHHAAISSAPHSVLTVPQSDLLHPTSQAFSHAPGYTAPARPPLLLPALALAP